MFRFILKNNSKSETVSFEAHEIHFTTDFLAVYKKAEKIKNVQLVGSPYVGYGGEQLFILIKILPESRFTVCEISWLNNPKNTPLLKGSYFTDFNFTFELNNYKKTFHIHRDFYIE